MGTAGAAGAAAAAAAPFLTPRCGAGGNAVAGVVVVVAANCQQIRCRKLLVPYMSRKDH